MGLLGLFTDSGKGGGGVIGGFKKALSLKSVTHILQTYTLPKEDPKTYKSRNQFVIFNL